MPTYEVQVIANYGDVFPTFGFQGKSFETSLVSVTLSQIRTITIVSSQIFNLIIARVRLPENTTE